jgi:hypothetical protein
MVRDAPSVILDIEIGIEEPPDCERDHCLDRVARALFVHVPLPLPPIRSKLIDSVHYEPCHDTVVSSPITRGRKGRVQLMEAPHGSYSASAAV